MIKLCECGCGKPAPINKESHPSRGLIVGEPLRFIFGHQPRTGQPTKHGMSGSPELNSFYHARRRCQNPKDTAWKYYGGRGIQFLFKTVEELIADIGLRPSIKHTLDRKNNDGNYEPGNVRWATMKEQCETRRNNGGRHKKEKSNGVLTERSIINRKF